MGWKPDKPDECFWPPSGRLARLDLAELDDGVVRTVPGGRQVVDKGVSVKQRYMPEEQLTPRIEVAWKPDKPNK